MGYEIIDKPEGCLYHYTKRENLEQILKDQKIKKFRDHECWFCRSLDDVLWLMEQTVMQEGKMYYDTDGLPRRYPAFVPEEYVVLKLTPRFQNGDWVIWNQELPEKVSKEVKALGEKFSHLKVGFRGNLKFKDPDVYEVAELLQSQKEVNILQFQM